MIEWPQVVLALINMAQVVALAWIARHQQQVKTELARVNGTIERKLDRIADAQ